MRALPGLLKFEPFLAEAESILEVWFQPSWIFGHRVGMAHPLAEPRAKTSE
jgi:hypothetical protein